MLVSGAGRCVIVGFGVLRKMTEIGVTFFIGGNGFGRRRSRCRFSDAGLEEGHRDSGV